MQKLFTPMFIRNLCVENRLVMPPMATAKGDAHDAVSEEICAYYQERAKYSRIGLIITEHCYIHLQGKAHPRQISIADDAMIPGLQKLTDCIHSEGVKVFAQINHAGSATSAETTGQPIVGPSAAAHPRKKGVEPCAMTAEQIRETVSWFAQAALRAKKAGYDGVEIHSAHGYLLNQFYSPLTNFRTDEYGCQSIENRTRFHAEVIAAVREAVGADYPVAIRLGGCDYAEGGSTIEDCAEACRIFEACGVDLIDLTGGLFGYVRPDCTEPGYFKDMTVAVKKAVQIPVLLTGGVTTAAEAEALLEAGCADLIGVGRAIYSNAHWAEKTE